jgi:hypothetical protein
MTMAYESDYMPSAGRDKAVTAEQIFEMMKGSDRPAWSAKDVGDYYDVSTPTAKDRLKELDEHGWVETVQVSNVTGYFVPESDNLDLVERHKQSLVHEFTDKFVGLPTAPWTAVHPNDGPAEAGDKVQIRVEGTPDHWRQLMTHAWPNRREKLIYEETTSGETQALISGELYAKPTVPIEHENYPPDYDLELNIGAEYKEVDDRQILIAAGVKNYLVKPCDDAVFLKNVSVDWMSPKGHGQELETVNISDQSFEEMVEEVEEWREENIEERNEYKHADSPEAAEGEQTDREFVEEMLDSNSQEVSEQWVQNLFAPGKLALDDEIVELLATHPNSPLESEEEVRSLVKDGVGTEGGEHTDEQ